MPCFWNSILVDESLWISAAAEYVQCNNKENCYGEYLVDTCSHSHIYVLAKSPLRGMLPVYKPSTQGHIAPEWEGDLTDL